DVVVANSLLGTLSTDGKLVFAVDDLPIPPDPGGLKKAAKLGKPLEEAIKGNRLQAYGLRLGEMSWELGGKPSRKEDPDFGESFFLGAPLPLGDKLYVLNEKDQEIRLVCLAADTGEVLWLQPLALPAMKLPEDSFRRTQAVHLAYAEGILVCPTNTGAILGVDILSRSTVWVHSYREKGQ